MENKLLSNSVIKKLTGNLRKMYSIKVKAQNETGSRVRYEGDMVKCYGSFCPNCHSIIFSLYRHDYNECKCGECMVDGGFDYTRQSVNGMSCTIGIPVKMFIALGLDFPKERVYNASKCCRRSAKQKIESGVHIPSKKTRTKRKIHSVC